MNKSFGIFIAFWTMCGCQNRNSGSPDAQQNRYYRIYQEIYSEWGTISLDSTQKKLDRYLQEFPENADAQMMAGNIACSLADYDKAVVRYKTAIRLQPNQAIFYSALGSVFNIQDKPDSAEKYLLKAIDLNDSSAYTFMNASLLYLKERKGEKSLAFADSAYAKGSNSSVICSGLSYIYYQQGEKGKAREYLKKAVNLGLKDTAAFNEVLDGKMNLVDYYRTNYQR